MMCRVCCIFRSGVKLLHHERISKDEVLKLMIDYMGVSPEATLTEMERTRGAHARFEFLKKIYTYELLRAEQARGDDE